MATPRGYHEQYVFGVQRCCSNNNIKVGAVKREITHILFMKWLRGKKHISYLPKTLVFTGEQPYFVLFRAGEAFSISFCFKLTLFNLSWLWRPNINHVCDAAKLGTLRWWDSETPRHPLFVFANNTQSHRKPCLKGLLSISIPSHGFCTRLFLFIYNQPINIIYVPIGLLIFRKNTPRDMQGTRSSFKFRDN